MMENNRQLRTAEQQEGAAAAARAKRGVMRKRGRTRAIVNIFDMIIITLILLVVVLLAVGVRMSDIFGTDAGRPVRLTYSVQLTNVDEAFAQTINYDDTVWNAETGEMIGTVRLAPTIEPYTTVELEEVKGTAADGSSTLSYAAVLTEHPGRVNVTVSIAVTASYLEGSGYITEEQAIRVGEAYVLRFPGYVGRAVCSSIDGAVLLKNGKGAS